MASDRTAKDYSSFRIVSERNIFNAHRSARSAAPPVRPPRPDPPKIDSFSLVGTLASASGAYAFFDSSTPDYRKAIRQNETIADFKLSAVHFNAVELVKGTNTVEVRVGMQVRREDNGPWQVALADTSSRSSHRSGSRSSNHEDRSDRNVVAAADPSEKRSATGADDNANDVLKRLMERRKRERR